MQTNSLWLPIVCLAPVVLAAYFIGEKRRTWREQNKAPFDELKRRPPGEYLRLKLESIDGEISHDTMLLVGFPFFLTVAGVCLGLPGVALPALGFVFSSIWTAIFGMRLYRLAKDRANYQLGFDGERYVAEELNRLMTDGFEIYHDIQFDGFNVDHILVGPRGVFSVETKTRRKPVDKKETKAYRVEFDGHSLIWPRWKSSHDIEQAGNNARTVARWLTGAVGETVTVTPILTLPGWMVERKAPTAAVQVVNPKEIVKIVRSIGQPRDEKLFQRICYQLDQKSRLEIE